MKECKRARQAGEERWELLGGGVGECPVRRVRCERCRRELRAGNLERHQRLLCRFLTQEEEQPLTGSKACQDHGQEG